MRRRELVKRPGQAFKCREAPQSVIRAAQARLGLECQMRWEWSEALRRKQHRAGREEALEHPAAADCPGPADNRVLPVPQVDRACRVDRASRAEVVFRVVALQAEQPAAPVVQAGERVEVVEPVQVARNQPFSLCRGCFSIACRRT